jgi:hypothetical protein
MTIEQAVLENLRELPTDKQQEVLDFIQFLKHKLPPNKPTFNPDGESIEFTDDDFANLRDRSPGREVEL